MSYLKSLALAALLLSALFALQLWGEQSARAALSGGETLGLPTRLLVALASWISKLWLVTVPLTVVGALAAARRRPLHSAPTAQPVAPPSDRPESARSGIARTAAIDTADIDSRLLNDVRGDHTDQPPRPLPTTAPTASGSLAARIQELLRSKNVDDLRQLAGSEGPIVTDVLVDALDTNPDPQVKIMAIDSLGLTSDPRAARVLAEVFKDSTGYPREIAALSLANIVANRVKSPETIPSLTSIVRDKSLKTVIRGQAVMALCRFRGDDAAVAQFLEELRNDPNEDKEIKFAAM